MWTPNYHTYMSRILRLVQDLLNTHKNVTSNNHLSAHTKWFIGVACIESAIIMLTMI